MQLFHDIYEGRDEAYEHFDEALEVAKEWMQLHDMLDSNHRRLQKIVRRYELDQVTYDQIVKLNKEDLAKLRKDVARLQKAINRRNAWLYALGAVVVAETVTVVVLAGIR